jgi:hypothetical protein
MLGKRKQPAPCSTGLFCGGKIVGGRPGACRLPPTQVPLSEVETPPQSRYALSCGNSPITTTYAIGPKASPPRISLITGKDQCRARPARDSALDLRAAPLHAAGIRRHDPPPTARQGEAGAESQSAKRRAVLAKIEIQIPVQLNRPVCQVTSVAIAIGLQWLEPTQILHRWAQRQR